MLSSPITLLLNWHVTTYHAPILLAKTMGFFEAEGLDLAILEPSDPSDVTKIVGTRGVNLALKALVHCFAARERGYPVKAVATVFDEPPSGVISTSEQAIKSVVDLAGKRIGYVGEFGKYMLNDLAMRHNLDQGSYEAIRVGMHGINALASGRVDAFMGINCIQGLELEHCAGSAHMLRIDEIADLGCCCFCSIALIAHDDFIVEQPDAVRAVCRALQRGMHYTVDNPHEALEHLKIHWPRLNTPHFSKSFFCSLPYFSRHLENVSRDWAKVASYALRLGICQNTDLADLYTNEFLVSSSASCNITTRGAL